MTLCKDCRWLSDTAKGQHWVRWTCAQTQNHQVNFMTGEIEPYILCRFVNDAGDCPMFEAGPNCLNPQGVSHESK